MSFTNVLNLPKPRSVKGITAEQRRDIFSFLQGSVYCWCKNRKDEPFTARDLLGGDNYYWQDTPMEVLYRYYLDGDNANSEYAV